jgi:hypothetical protein
MAGRWSKIYLMKLLSVWMWESLENLPLLLGFVIAARLWRENRIAWLSVLVAGMGLGVLVTRYVEPKLHKGNHKVRWTSTLVNFLLFVVLAIPFVYYFRADTRWINWKMDLLAGVAAALLLTFIQSAHWTESKSRMFLHGAAMVVSFPVIMVGLRYIIRMEDWGLSVLFTFFLMLLASLIITLIDYQEMYRMAK